MHPPQRESSQLEADIIPLSLVAIERSVEFEVDLTLSDTVHEAFKPMAGCTADILHEDTITYDDAGAFLGKSWDRQSDGLNEQG